MHVAIHVLYQDVSPITTFYLSMTQSIQSQYLLKIRFSLNR